MFEFHTNCDVLEFFRKWINEYIHITRTCSREAFTPENNIGQDLTILLKIGQYLKIIISISNDNIWDNMTIFDHI